MINLPNQIDAKTTWYNWVPFYKFIVVLLASSISGLCFTLVMCWALLKKKKSYNYDWFSFYFSNTFIIFLNVCLYNVSISATYNYVREKLEHLFCFQIEFTYFSFRSIQPNFPHNVGFRTETCDSLGKFILFLNILFFVQYAIFKISGDIRVSKIKYLHCTKLTMWMREVKRV